MKIVKFLFSGTLMGILLLIFAIVIGYATFIENDYDATTARMLIYNARWFELLMFLMVVNFTGMIFTRKLYRKEQFNVLLIHLSLIIILIGAGITRYFGFEGLMHIRNGEVSNTFSSNETYISINTEDKSILEEVALSTGNKDYYSKTFEVGNESVEFAIKSFYTNAVEKLIRTPIGSPILEIIVQDEEHTHSNYVKEGESKYIHELGISFGDTSRFNHVHILNSTDSIGLQIRLPLNYQAKTAEPGKRTHSKFIPLKPGAKYRFSGMTLVLKEHIENGLIKYQPAENDEQQGTPIINVKINEVETALKFNQPQTLMVGEKPIRFGIGNLQLKLPFSIHLKEFQLERYPGSNSPSSFASEIILIDKNENLTRDYRIFMNNILSYKGYRFYQSSYDSDEKGTVLSVNHDYWGTVVTYTGYFLLFGSLILTFFTRKTRFARLLKQFDKIREKRKALTSGLVVLLLMIGGSQNAAAQMGDNVPMVNKEHAATFGRLQLQNPQGRMMPVNTMASEFLVKIHKKDTYDTLNADQVFLEMIRNPLNWIGKPMIKVGHEELKELIGVTGNHARYIDFFTQQGEYRIAKQVNDAYRKRPAIRSKLDKELINVDERVNVFTMVFNGSLIRIFPIPHHPNNTWGDGSQFESVAAMMGEDSLLTNYINQLTKSGITRDYKTANEALSAISTYQKEKGKEVLLSDRKVNLEIFYNKSSIFKRLFPIYLTLGIVLTGLFFVQVFKPRVRLTKLTRALAAILFLGFLGHTFGLILRWYISGHAPWSNGYESMLYISWVTVLSGLIFMKKSQMTLAVTSLLAGITLLTAHMSWMNPEITNLVPVLKSYWLTVHVATITASYGFLGLGAMLGFMNLCIMIFRTRLNKERINLILEELTIIIEMTLMIGLVLLIIGNFLGGIWANESWGRYWGWDPKETWTLVTVITYSFVLHMNLIPKVRSIFSFNFGALIGFGTVLMTYFGVNFYLSGLHSYAKGDPVPIPSFVYYLVAIISLVSLLAAINGYRLGTTGNGKQTS